MNLIEAIRLRRAVRSYGDQPLDEHTMHWLLAAAVQAPSALNAQPWRFVIVQGTERLRRYSDRAKELLRCASADNEGHRHLAMFDDKNFNIFYNAPTLIVICGNASDQYLQADCWLAAQNLMLAARDAGFGTCPIGLAIPALNDVEIKAELGIPKDVVAVAPIVVGAPSSPMEQTSRAEPRILSWVR